MKQPIANVHFRLSKEPENIIQLKNVTPAELMLLCTMHKVNAKGSPVVKLREIPEKEEDTQIAEIRAKLAGFDKEQAALDKRDDISEEHREKRLASYQTRVNALQSVLEDWARVKALRTLSPSEERKRLCGKYDGNMVKAFYPGAIPTLPTSFKDAQETADEIEVEQPRFMVNNERLSGAGVQPQAANG